MLQVIVCLTTNCKGLHSAKQLIAASINTNQYKQNQNPIFRHFNFQSEIQMNIMFSLPQNVKPNTAWYRFTST